MGIALAVFLLAFVGIAALFALKYWEGRAGRLLVPSAHQTIDAWAHELKLLLARSRTEAEHLMPTVLRLVRTLLHAGALAAASAARYVERELHRLADMVSHKRNFTPRESNNEFLKQVSEHPLRDVRSSGANNNGNGSGDADTTAV